MPMLTRHDLCGGEKLLQHRLPLLKEPFWCQKLRKAHLLHEHPGRLNRLLPHHLCLKRPVKSLPESCQDILLDLSVELLSVCTQISGHPLKIPSSIQHQFAVQRSRNLMNAPKPYQSPHKSTKISNAFTQAHFLITKCIAIPLNLSSLTKNKISFLVLSKITNQAFFFFFEKSR